MARLALCTCFVEHKCRCCVNIQSWQAKLIGLPNICCPIRLPWLRDSRLHHPCCLTWQIVCLACYRHTSCMVTIDWWYQQPASPRFTDTSKSTCCLCHSHVPPHKIANDMGCIRSARRLLPGQLTHLTCHPQKLCGLGWTTTCTSSLHAKAWESRKWPWRQSGSPSWQPCLCIYCDSMDCGMKEPIVMCLSGSLAGPHHWLATKSARHCIN